MITWDYRVFREEDGVFVIREVFYDEGTITGCTESAVEPMGESLEELAKDIDDFKAALKLPVLTLTDIPNSPKKKRNPTRSKGLTTEQVRAKLGLDKRPSNHKRTQQKNGKRKSIAASAKRKVAARH